jgi:hypothetical protein
MWFTFSSPATSMWGSKRFTSGQVGLMDKNDPGHAGWLDMLGRVRAYAHEHARRHFLVCDAHTPTGGYVEGGKLLFDFHSFPLRIVESRTSRIKASSKLAMPIPSSRKARVASHRAAGAASTCRIWWSSTTSAGAIPANPARHLSSGVGMKSPGSPSLPEKERNDWLRYAWKWVKDTDANGHLQMPGSRVLSPGMPDAPRWYWANARSEACPNGFNTEETIKELWNGPGASK